MKRIFILSASAIFFLCTSAFAADISGDWTIQFTDIMGQQKWDVNFKTTGETLDIAVKAQMGDMKGTGTLKGDQISFTVTQKGGGGDMYIDFKGTVKDNKMEGTREMYADPTGAGYTGGARPGSSGSASDQGGAQSAAGARGNAPSGGQGAAPSGGQGGAPAGAPQGGNAPQGGQGGPPSTGGATAGGQAKGGNSDSQNLASNTWSAVKK